MKASPKNPKDALSRLKDGNKAYRKDTGSCEARDQKERDKWLTKQEPWAIILSCADSRVSPEFIFDTGIGELFVIRVAGNVANTSSIASIEYAVAHLNVPLIVVLGHQSCGAVSAALGGGDNGHNLNHLLAHITPAVAKTKGDPSEPATIKKCVKKNAKLQVKELQERSSIISSAVAKGKLEIVDAYYQLSGKVDF
jgi:carbonic anhydrase